MNAAHLEYLKQLVSQEVAEAVIASAAQPLSGAERAQQVEQFARESLDRWTTRMVETGDAPPTLEQEEHVVRHVIAGQLGLGRLQLLLDDENIENIDINGFDNVWVKRPGGIKEHVANITDNDADLVELIQRAARAHNTGGERRIDSSKPIVDLHLPGGHRLSAMIDVAHRPCVSIRRHRMSDPTLDDISSSFSPELLRFLKAAVKARFNIIVSGGTDAGKTTLLRAMLAECEPMDRIITIELAYELDLHHQVDRHPDCIAWETREKNTEGAGEITMDYLVQRANRHNPDRVVVGEVLGDEIVPMLNAMTSGRAGSMCTIHADSSEGTFGRIKSYASQSPKHLTEEAAAQLTAQALDLVVYTGKYTDQETGLVKRAVKSVRSVEDCDGRHVISSEIFTMPPGGGPAVPHMTIPPQMRERLMPFGYEAPAGIFGREVAVS